MYTASNSKFVFINVLHTSVSGEAILERHLFVLMRINHNLLMTILAYLLMFLFILQFIYLLKYDLCRCRYADEVSKSDPLIDKCIE